VAREKKKLVASMPLWMNTFCDMVLLVLTFFVLLYSMSSLDVAKWKVFAATLDQMSKIWPDYESVNAREEIPEDRESAGENKMEFAIKEEDVVNPETEWGKVISKIVEEAGRMNSSSQIASEDGDQGIAIAVESNDFEIILRCPGDVLFGTMDAAVRPAFYPTLDKIMNDLVLPEFDKGTISLLRIEGHTDERKVTSNHSYIKDNLDLSSARALSVAKYILGNYQIPPEKLSAEGRGEWHPVNPDGKSNPKQYRINRRVEFIMKRDLEKLPQEVSDEDVPYEEVAGPEPQTQAVPPVQEVPPAEETA